MVSSHLKGDPHGGDGDLGVGGEEARHQDHHLGIIWEEMRGKREAFILQ
jgi:hypothetical protein